MICEISSVPLLDLPEYLLFGVFLLGGHQELCPSGNDRQRVVEFVCGSGGHLGQALHRLGLGQLGAGAAQCAEHVYKLFGQAFVLFDALGHGHCKGGNAAGHRMFGLVFCFGRLHGFEEQNPDDFVLHRQRGHAHQRGV